MELLRAMHADLGLEFDVGRARRPGDELRVRRDLLACPAAREELHDRDRVVDRRDDLLDPHDGDVHRGQSRGEVGVAFVGDEHERPRVGDEGVAAGDPDVRIDEALPQFLPRDGDERRDVVRDRMTHDLAEELGDLLAGLVDSGGDDVRRPLAGELDDPLAEVGLHSVDALRLEVIGESDFLSGHRLRFDDELRLLRAADRGDHPARFVGVDRTVDLGADRFGFAGESLHELRHVVDRLCLAPREVRAQVRPVDLAHPRVAALLQLGERATERGAESIRPEGAIQAAFELGLRSGQVRATPART